MRRRNNSISMGKIIGIIVLVVIAMVGCFKLFSGGSKTSEYKKYVRDFEDAVYEYADKELPSNFSKSGYPYLVVKQELISKGYLKEYEDSSVIISGDDIIISKENYNVSFYNYNNTETFENRFQLKFEKNGKSYICTKNSCK